VGERSPLESAPPIAGALRADLKARRDRHAEQINRRNLAYFEQEVQKLDAWADDLKVGLEQEIKEMDRQISEVRRTASAAPTLDEKLHWQRQQRELEQRRTRLRRELFDRQDEVEAGRNRLIDELEAQLIQESRVDPLFTIQWALR
jgi:predicted RNase H-like nuclease (RuvC/YqgF family)